ncbi:hypothetical protein A9R05_32825 (plasmid) [Burkholderia sp. KK1]|nr:hypothetical protein A9R05_32825 [Burkholderia sp. KK1]
MTETIRVAIADDHPIVLSGLRKTLESAGFDVLGAETGPSGLLALLENSSCDVVITDYSMPDDDKVDGWRFIATVSSDFPEIPVLVYSEFEDPFLLGTLAQRGIPGIVSKREEMHEVLRAVRILAKGGRYLSPIAHEAVERFGGLPEMRRFTSLTRRQMEIAGLMLCGMTVAETARLLHRRINTVSSQRHEACRRLGFSSESDIYRFAFGHGLSLERSSRDVGSELYEALAPDDLCGWRDAASSRAA